MDKETDLDHLEAAASHADKDGPITGPVVTEQVLTLKDVFKNHKTLVWWSFFWAMCAVGWYVLIFSKLPSTTNSLCRGFDAQINGAMISVAAFRRDFG